MDGIWRWKTAQFAERKWWKNYLNGKEVQPYLAWKRKYWKDLVAKCQHYFDPLKCHKVLDAGCGPAGIFMIFDQADTTAFDPLLHAYEKDLPHFKESMYPGIKFVNAGLEDFSHEGQFDLVFCMNAINHVHDIKKSFDRLVSFAASGAYLVVTIDAHTHSIFKQIFRMIPGDILHPHQYDLNEYQQMLTSRDCSLIGTELLKHAFFFDHYMLIAKKN